MQQTIVHRLVLVFLTITTYFFSGAQEAALKLEWELLTNLSASRYKSEAALKIRNVGEQLNSSNWAIFFSMDPMDIEPMDGKALLELKHLNGDWFRLTPKPGFSLAPGEETVFRYAGGEYLIKEGLGPKGFYMVVYNPDGKEQSIRPIKDFRMVPFTRTEQLVRGREEGYLPVSPERIYAENEPLTLVSKEKLIPIVPTPNRYSKAKGSLQPARVLGLRFDTALGFEASYLQEKMAALIGVSFVSASPPAKTDLVQLKIDTTLAKGVPEAYQLTIDKQGIIVKGTDAAGVFYGVQSLLSLLIASKGTDGLVRPPFVHIADQPRFAFRSLHLDVARNFQTKETVLRVLDIMAHYKLNNLLLYTSEDEGWRVEIPGLPELTEMGSNRLHPANGRETAGLFPAFGSGPFAELSNYGSGYYTRQDFIDILKYAKQRHIRIVPELNSPAHARAAIVAMENRYERLMKSGDRTAAEAYRLKDPSDTSRYRSAQFFKDNVVDISSESVYRFYDKIITEFSKMYQEAGLDLRVIHAGGDEVAAGAWSGSAKVARWALEKGIQNDYLSLQAAFFKELVRRMEQKGLEIHGWEEAAIRHTGADTYIANPEFVHHKVVPYIWNNEFSYPDMGYRMANLGYDIVLCNVTNLYFDLAYNNDPKEPGLMWGGFVDTKKTWAFAPYNFQNTTLINRFGKEVHLDADPQFERLKAEAKPRIKGVQAQLWAETIKGREMLEYYLLPKLIGFSETAWGKERKWESVANRKDRLQQLNKDWNLFANRIAQYELPKLRQWNGGYHFRIPPVGTRTVNGKLSANTAFPGLDIRYTTDNTEPVLTSPKYQHPIDDVPGLKLKAFVQ